MQQVFILFLLTEFIKILILFFDIQHIFTQNIKIMQKYLLLGIFLSSKVFTYGQENPSTHKPIKEIPQIQTVDNNIKYIHFQRKRYIVNDTPLNFGQTPDSEDIINEYVSNEFSSSWFFNASGGASAFLGDPLGCEDLFGRIRPVFHLSIGKWFSPIVGGRIAFQGFDLKNHFIERQKYHHFHTDFLWNISNLFQKDRIKTRWQFIPYTGTGIIYSNATNRHPFTLNYGILNHLHLTKHLSLSLELGGLTTFGDFDGAGKRNKFTDHLFHFSTGISITLWKKDWNTTKNRINNLLNTNNSITYGNELLEIENRQNNSTINQMRKIIKTKGLLSDIQNDQKNVGPAQVNDSVSAANFIFYPKNDYSGLNSLKKRLSTATQDQNKNFPDKSTKHLSSKIEKNEYSHINKETSATIPDSIHNCFPNHTQENAQDYITSIIDYNTHIGSPILFFFHIGTATLTDSSQLANIDEIARICKKYDLSLKVTGYADSATGNSADNSVLSNQRANYIVSELKKREISERAIKLYSKGGVDTYTPIKVNRCAIIEIHLKH